MTSEAPRSSGDDGDGEDHGSRWPTDRRTMLKGMAAVAGWGALSRLLPGQVQAAVPADGLDALAGILDEDRGAQRFRDTFDRADAATWGSPWLIDGVANLAVEGGKGRLEAGTNIYPSDKRAVAVLTDHRVTDGAIAARMPRHGVGAGLVLRRVGPKRHYAAILDREAGALTIVARSPEGERVLARGPLTDVPEGEIVLGFQAEGTDETHLVATVGTPQAETVLEIDATDGTPALQGPGDAGVLVTAETGFRAGPSWRTPAGTQSARAAWVVDQATQAKASPVPLTQARRAATELASTAVVDEVALFSDQAPSVTAPSVQAATTLQPAPGGARVGVVADGPAEVTIEVSQDGSFSAPLEVPAGETNALLAAFATFEAGVYGGTVHWRARLERHGVTRRGPVRSLRTLPAPGDGDPVRLAIGACATQFSTTFPAIADADPDVFVWQGDINYIDASGPLAQTLTGYAGMWTDILNTPELTPIVHDAAFCTTRDDHDYGKNDNWKETVEPHGVEAYEKRVNPDPYYRFGGGLVDAWVLDQRQWRDDPSGPDDEGKSLIGAEQKAWLKRTLAASDAPFKVVCSPDPLFNVPNASDSWATVYTTERDELLAFIDEQVSGRTVFVTDDTHSGAVSRVDGTLEVRAAPMDIPGPGQHDASSGETVLFSEQGKFFCLIDVLEVDGVPTMEIRLNREDGTPAWQDTLTQPREA